MNMQRITIIKYRNLKKISLLLKDHVHLVHKSELSGRQKCISLCNASVLRDHLSYDTTVFQFLEQSLKTSLTVYTVYTVICAKIHTCLERPLESSPNAYSTMI